MIDLLVDYILHDCEFRHYAIKMDTSDMKAACEEAVYRTIVQFSGQAYLIHHVPGNHSIAELNAVASGKKTAKMVPVWAEPTLVKRHCSFEEIAGMLPHFNDKELQAELALLLVPNSENKSAVYFSPLHIE